MYITYLGQCGFLIEIGGVRIVTDPHLSDCLNIKYGGTNWIRAYAPPCSLYEAKPDITLISHSHDDHMDPMTLSEYRQAGGNCKIAAPAPECGMLYELKFTNVIEARAESPITIGNVKITPIMCAHTEPHTDDIGRFRELSYIIEAEGEKVFFGGDLSLYDGLTERLRQEKPDCILIPANGRDEKRTSQGIIGNTTCAEAANLARECSATLIPTHYDLYASNGCPTDMIVAAADDAGAKLIMPKVNERIKL